MPKNINDIENKISGLACEYIKTQAKSSLFLLLSDCVERRKEGDLCKGFPQTIGDICDKTDLMVTELEDVLKKSPDKKEQYFWECTEMKKGLVSVYSRTSRLMSLLNLYLSPVADELELRRYRAEDIPKEQIGFDMLYQDIFNFLSSAREENKGQSEEAVLNSLSIFKLTCAPDSFEDFSELFPEINSFIFENKELNTEDMTEKELSCKYDAFLDKLHFLSDVSDIASRLFNCVNSLIILLYLNFDMDDLTEGGVSYKDLYYSAVEILKEDGGDIDKAVLIETLSPLFDKYIEPLIDKASEINRGEADLLGGLTDISGFLEETKKLLFTESFIRDTFYENIEDAIYAFDYDSEAPAAGKAFKDAEFKDFMSYMSGYFETLPIKLRKNAMRNLLASLPVAMSESELVAYIKNAVDSSYYFESKVMILDRIGFVFESNGFDPLEDGCSCGHEHHNHDCGCGHCH